MELSLGAGILAFIFPAFVLFMSLCYLIGRPKPDNKLIGFRTERSMSSRKLGNAAISVWQALFIGRWLRVCSVSVSFGF